MAVRQGCEIVDVELELGHEQIFDISGSNRPRSVILSSYHDMGHLFSKVTGDAHLPVSDSSCEAIYRAQSKVSDISKLVMSCNNISDSLNIESFMSKVKSTTDGGCMSKPLILIGMGDCGRISRVLNTILTPVTHNMLPEKAVPGQLDIVSINLLRYNLGLTKEKYIYLLGSPISKSPSPLVLNTAFRTVGLPYEYKLHEISSGYEELREFVYSEIKNGTFGGASVTIPMKIECVSNKLCKKLSPTVTAIGSLNTLYIDDSDGSPVIAGDNTDFIGIEAIFRRYILVSGVNECSTKVGVIIGSGGTARASVCALKSAGCKRIYVWNREVESAMELAEAFGVSYVQDLREVLKDLDIDDVYLVVGAIPSYGQKSYSAMIHDFIRGASGGCVLGMAYGEVTELIHAAKSASCKWDYADGLVILVEQASYQFRIFTGHLTFPSAARELLASKCDVSRGDMLLPL